MYTGDDENVNYKLEELCTKNANYIMYAVCF